MKKNLKGIAGIVLILIAIAGMFLWESYGREALTYSEVLVMRQDVQPGTVIKEDMLGLMKVDKELLIEGSVTDYRDIVGQKAKNFIPAKLQLSKRFFEKDGLLVGEGNYICVIPKEWLCAYPQTIRRGDTVYFYEVKADSQEITPSLDSLAILKVKVAYVKDSANREVVDVTADRIDGSAETANIEIILSDKQFALLRSSVDAGHKFVLAYE